MILSRDRILTTHVGSLPRNEALSELLVRREAGERYDAKLFDAEMEKAVRHVVAKQKEAGIEIAFEDVGGEIVVARNRIGRGRLWLLHDRPFPPGAGGYRPPSAQRIMAT